MKLKLFISIIVPTTIVLVSIFIYPTLYKYDKLDQKYPVKINRLTGKTEILTMNGWTSFDKPFIQVGSTKEEVRNSMGDPDRILDSVNQWIYGNSIIRFSDSDRVELIVNNDKNLRVK